MTRPLVTHAASPFLSFATAAAAFLATFALCRQILQMIRSEGGGTSSDDQAG